MASTAAKEESPAESSAMARERESQHAFSASSKGKHRMSSGVGVLHTPSIPPMYHSMIAGAGAGLVSSIATCPLDVIKTRLQASSAPGETVKQLITTIWRTRGIRGLYRGLGPTILGYLPTWGIYFSVYDDVKDKLGKSIGARMVNPDGTVVVGTNEQWLVHILAAMTAGATGTIATNPLWVIKTRFMAQSIMGPNERRYKHTLDACRTIYREEGLGAFYKGLAPSLLGVTHVAVQFPLYEQLKLWAATHDNTPLSSQTILACSASSKMVASCVTYPHEVLRTRLQVHRSGYQRAPLQPPVELPPWTATAGVPPPVAAGAADSIQQKAIPKGLVAEFKYILHNDGLKGFYRGLSINLLRTVPSNAVTMLTYELIMRRLASS